GEAQHAGEEAESAVENREQARDRPERARARRIQPEEGEQRHALEGELVELGRMPRKRAAGALEYHAPGNVGHPAPQLLVDEVADAPGAEPERRKRRGEVGDREEAASRAPRIEPHGDDDADQGTVKGHAAAP